MLEVNTKAPDFSLKDQNGKIHTLSDYSGRKVLLYFYPKDNTPGCTKQACSYSILHKEFEKYNTVIIGISKDSVKSHKNFENKQNLSITLLSDESTQVISAYDAWKEKKNYGKTYMGTLRTTYLIDEKGIIIYASDKVKAAEDAAKMLLEVEKTKQP
ncbi:thioredoxin-dependent thiol peroxidase [Succinivibrio sp.]|uniref:thioredoxin-dependent thiol peroxidase n=1 Tax=Succinivibrio sp. TaxID=2053619 RepID=UPI002590FBD8|nr:thioredoxin-dependent thiol peroxidase [Succinivibrio sp.]MDD6206069.1 thioredoxin-dependent thiol peroxidase [Succinivibrio sp.]